MAFRFHGECIGTHSVLRHWDAWRYDWTARLLSTLLAPACLYGTYTFTFFFSHFLSSLGGMRYPAAAKVGFSRRLRHGHPMYVTTPPAALSRHAYFLIERWPIHYFLAPSSDGDVRESTFAN